MVFEEQAFRNKLSMGTARVPRVSRVTQAPQDISVYYYHSSHCQQAASFLFWYCWCVGVLLGNMQAHSSIQTRAVGVR